MGCTGQENNAVSIYIHIPFCRKKCGYCDFFSVASGGPVYRAVLEKTLRQVRSFVFSNSVRDIRSLFIGGGTPSSLPLPLLDWFLGSLTDILPSAGTEFTVEINPEDASEPLFEVLEKHGVDRLSMGVQSLNEETLRMLGRNASAEDTRKALKLAAGRWKGRRNFDLITSVPGQSRDNTIEDLKRVLSFNPDHISLYTLTFEENTPITGRLKKGLIKKQPEESEIRTYDAAIDLLEDEGLYRYEISNFSVPGSESVHNTAYWELRPYFGAGPSAVSTVSSPEGPLRIENPRSIESFLSEKPEGRITVELIAPESFLLEHLLAGFRLVRGIRVDRIEEVFGIDFPEYFSRTLNRWEKHLSPDDGCLSLDRDGLRLLDSFLSDLAAEIEVGTVKECRWP